MMKWFSIVPKLVQVPQSIELGRGRFEVLIQTPERRSRVQSSA